MSQRCTFSFFDVVGKWSIKTNFLPCMLIRMINGIKHHMGTTFHTKFNNPICVGFFLSLQLETLQMKYFNLCIGTHHMHKWGIGLKNFISYNIFQ